MRNDFNIIMISKLDFRYVLNSYQYERLLDLYDKITDVNNRRSEIIKLHTNVFDGNRQLALGDAILYLKNMVCEVQTNERIINNKIR